MISDFCANPDNIEKLIRIVMTPTARERWYAFWRLYRMIDKASTFGAADLSDAARLVFRAEQYQWFCAVRLMRSDRLQLPLACRAGIRRASRSRKGLGGAT